MPSFRRLGINALFLEPRMGGLDTYARALISELRALAPGLEISLYLNRRGRDHVAREPWAQEVRMVSHPLLGVRGTRAIAELTALGALARNDDVLHSLAMTGPLRTRARHVVTLADTTWIDDASREGALTYRMWRAVIPRVARRAERVIAISEAAKRDVVARLGVPADRVDVTLLGHAEQGLPQPASGVRSRHGLPQRPIVLSVGTRKEHKNLRRLVEAMAQVPDAALVLAGNPTTLDGELRDRASALGVELHLLGFLPDEDLEGLYREASAFVLPSLNEGFGLPLLEAMRRGIPTATSDVSSLPEVAGDAALLFDPRDVDGMAAAARALIGDDALRARLTRAGPAQAARFTWTATAEATLASYERAWTRSPS